MRRKGFTLIEMLVVIAVILALLGILVAAIGPAMQTASSVAAQNFLTSMSAATVAFERDHGFYPPSDVTGGTMDTWAGAEIITQAITGVGKSTVDGINGYGAKKMKSDGSYSTTGRTYGPYLEIKHERTLNARWDQNASGSRDNGEYYAVSSGNPVARPNAYVLTIASSANSIPILYYKTTNAAGKWERNNAANSYYPPGVNRSHNGIFMEESVKGNGDPFGKPSGFTSWWHLPTTDTTAATDAQLNSTATSLRSAEFVFVSAGPDDKYGTKDDVIVTGP